MLAWDRFRYVQNNPVRYTDPSGHYYCEGDTTCDHNIYHTYDNVLTGILDDEYGVQFDGEMDQWTDYRITAVYLGVSSVGRELAKTLKGSGASAFKKVYQKGVTFIWGVKNIGSSCADIGIGGCTSSSYQINFTGLWGPTSYRSYEGALQMARNNVVHELGHAFGQMWYKGGGYEASGPYASIPEGMRDEDGWIFLPEPYRATWRQHEGGHTGSEIFADMFLGWTFGVFADNEFGNERRGHMTTNMAAWVTWAAAR